MDAQKRNLKLNRNILPSKNALHNCDFDIENQLYFTLSL